MASSRKAGTNESRWTNPGGAGGWEAGVNTIAASGADYTVLGTWEGDTDLDIVTATVSPVLEVAADVTVSSTTIGGATTSTTYFRCLRTASAGRHGGVANGGYQVSSTTDQIVLSVVENNFHVWDLDILHTPNSTTARSGVSIGGVTGCHCIGVIVKSANAGSGTNDGITYSNSGHTNWSVVNCIVYECDGNGYVARINASYFYNNTAVGNGGYGFTYVTQQPVWKNNLAQSNSGGDYNGNGTTGTTHNLASDTTAPETGTYYDSKTITFSNASSDDYRLTNDADAVGQGTDLSADAAFAFDDDIKYSTRS